MWIVVCSFCEGIEVDCKEIADCKEIIIKSWVIL